MVNKCYIVTLEFETMMVTEDGLSRQDLLRKALNAMEEALDTDDIDVGDIEVEEANRYANGFDDECLVYGSENPYYTAKEALELNKKPEVNKLTEDMFEEE